MKLINTIIFSVMLTVSAVAQGAFQKGKSVYVDAPEKELAAEIAQALRDWGYWRVASNAGEADIVMKVDPRFSGGVTWTSWGGKSVALSVELKSDGDSWKSPVYKASPNGSNRYNSQGAAVKKLVRGLGKQFR